jgi:hypothetical protein
MRKCVAVISRDNQPLFVHVHDQDSLKFQHFVHAALDVVEEKRILLFFFFFFFTIAIVHKSKGNVKNYLGFLCPFETYRVYGYVSNTGMKFITVYESSSLPDEPAIEKSLAQLHAAYISYQMNPFCSPDAIISADRFARMIQ